MSVLRTRSQSVIVGVVSCGRRSVQRATFKLCEVAVEVEALPGRIRRRKRGSTPFDTVNTLYVQYVPWPGLNVCLTCPR